MVYFELLKFIYSIEIYQKSSLATYYSLSIVFTKLQSELFRDPFEMQVGRTFFVDSVESWD